MAKAKPKAKPRPMYTSTFCSVCNKHIHNLNCDLRRSLVHRSSLGHRLGSRLRSGLRQILLLRLGSGAARLHNQSNDHNDQADNEDGSTNVDKSEVGLKLAVRLRQRPLRSAIVIGHDALSLHRSLVTLIFRALVLARAAHLLAIEISSSTALVIADHNRDRRGSLLRSSDAFAHHGVHSDRLDGVVGRGGRTGNDTSGRINREALRQIGSRKHVGNTAPGRTTREHLLVDLQIESGTSIAELSGSGSLAETLELVLVHSILASVTPSTSVTLFAIEVDLAVVGDGDRSTVLILQTRAGRRGNADRHRRGGGTRAIGTDRHDRSTSRSRNSGDRSGGLRKSHSGGERTARHFEGSDCVGVVRLHNERTVAKNRRGSSVGQTLGSQSQAARNIDVSKETISAETSGSSLSSRRASSGNS